MCRPSSRLLAAFSSASFIRLVLPVLAMLAYSLRLPPRLSCRRAGRPAFRLSSCVLLVAPACLLAVLRSAHPRVAVVDIIALLTIGGAVVDIIASPLRSAATVPPPTLLALSPRLFVSGGGEISGGLIGSDAIFFSYGIFARSGAFPGTLVL